MSYVFSVRTDNTLHYGTPRDAGAVNGALAVLGQLDAEGLAGTHGAERAETLRRFAARDSMDAAGKADLRRARWSTKDAARHVALWMLTNAQIRRSPTAFHDAVDLATRFCGEIAQHGATRDAAFNPTAGGAVFPALIGQLRAEMTPLPPASSERIFPRVIPESLPPGIQQYQAIRQTPVGNPAVGSGIANRDVPLMRVGAEQELRATAWLVLGAEQNYVAGLQAAIPGSPVVGLSQIQLRMRQAMAYGENRLFWYGDPAAEMVGLLDDPALLRYEIADGTATLASSTVTVLNAICDAIREAVRAGAGLYDPDVCVFSKALVASLVKPLSSSAGLTDTSMIAFLEDSVLRRQFPGIRFELASELDDIGGNGTSQTGKHGLMLTRSDELGVHRVPILPVTTLPIVEGGIVQTAYMVAQVGRPWVSGLGMNHLITIKES